LLSNITRKNIGEEIKKARKSKKLSQFELAELIGVDEKQIYRIESGITSPKLEVFLKIADILNLKIKCFEFIDINPMYTSEIIEIVNKSSENKRKIFLDLIKSINKNL